MIQQILARQRERVAAEKAAKALLEAEAAAGKADGGVAAAPVVESAAVTEVLSSRTSKLLLGPAYSKADMNSHCAIH